MMADTEETPKVDPSDPIQDKWINEIIMKDSDELPVNVNSYSIGKVDKKPVITPINADLGVIHIKKEIADIITRLDRTQANFCTKVIAMDNLKRLLYDEEGSYLPQAFISLIYRDVCEYFNGKFQGNRTALDISKLRECLPNGQLAQSTEDFFTKIEAIEKTYLDALEMAKHNRNLNATAIHHGDKAEDESKSTDKESTTALAIYLHDTEKLYIDSSVMWSDQVAFDSKLFGHYNRPSSGQDMNALTNMTRKYGSWVKGTEPYVRGASEMACIRQYMDEVLGHDKYPVANKITRALLTDGTATTVFKEIFNIGYSCTGLASNVVRSHWDRAPQNITPLINEWTNIQAEWTEQCDKRIGCYEVFESLYEKISHFVEYYTDLLRIEPHWSDRVIGGWPLGQHPINMATALLQLCVEMKGLVSGTNGWGVPVCNAFTALIDEIKAKLTSLTKTTTELNNIQVQSLMAWVADKLMKFQQLHQSEILLKNGEDKANPVNIGGSDESVVSRISELTDENVHIPRFVKTFKARLHEHKTRLHEYNPKDPKGMTRRSIL